MERFALTISVRGEIRLELYHAIKLAVLFVEAGLVLKKLMQALLVI